MRGDFLCVQESIAMKCSVPALRYINLCCQGTAPGTSVMLQLRKRLKIMASRSSDDF